MSYWEEDFYNEPSELDQLVDEFKSSLAESVKEEHKQEVERLRKENAELQEVKANLDKIKSDYEKKKRELEFERVNMVDKVRKERLSSLMKHYEILMYQAGYKYVKAPKCNKCDSNRRIEYKTPLGKKAYEDCNCNESETVFVPEEYLASEFRLNRDGDSVGFWYKRKSAYDDEDLYSYSSSTYASEIYSEEMDFAKLNRYETFFKTKEECQKFCDYLNEHKNEE